MVFTIKDFNFKDTFAREKFLLGLSGFYPMRKDDKTRFLRAFSAFLNLLFAYGQLISMIILLLVNKDAISERPDCLPVFITHFALIFKLASFIYNRKQIIQLEDLLTDDEFYGFENETLDLIKTRFEFCDLVASFYRSCILMHFPVVGGVPFMEGDFLQFLPFSGWFPFDTQKYYFICYICQMLSIGVSAYNNSAMDIFLWKLITVATAHFDILKANLNSIDYTLEDSKSVLTRCIKHHTKIIILMRLVEDTFSKGIFMQFLSSILVICVTFFQMVNCPTYSIDFASGVIYFCIMMTQVAMYCWFGHQAMMESDDIGRSLYISNWYKADLQTKKIIIIFLERLKKTEVLTAGNFVPLNLATLMGILKSSYSYFAVLRRVYEPTD